jgi:hypothetical protein
LHASQKVWAVLGLIALCSGPIAFSAPDDAPIANEAPVQRDLGAETWSNWQLTPALFELLTSARESASLEARWDD